MRQITTLFLFVLFSPIVSGQVTYDRQSNQTILFQVTHPNSPNISYLFGTHHAFGKAFFDSLANANQSLTNSNVLIKENLNIPGQMAEDIINRRTTTTKWRKYLRKRDLAFIEDMFETSPTDFNKMTPTEMYVFLTRHYKQQFCLSKDSTDTFLSLDEYIGFIAKQQNLKLVGLETTEEQIELINKDVEGMPRRVHKRRLANIITRIKSEKADSCEETDWYRQMDIDYQLKEPCRNTLVLTDRNNEWMPKIKKYLDSNNSFIAVGLSHLMYDCGLIAQLQILGYTITPVNLK